MRVPCAAVLAPENITEKNPQVRSSVGTSARPLIIRSIAQLKARDLSVTVNFGKESYAFPKTPIKMTGVKFANTPGSRGVRDWLL